MFLLGSSKQYHPYAVKLSSLSPAEPSHNFDCQYLLAVFVHGLCATKSPSHSVITDTSLSLFIICSFFPFAFWLYDSLYAYGLSLLLISASLYSLCSSCFSLSGFLCLSSSPITSWKCAGHFIDIADLRAKKRWVYKSRRSKWLLSFKLLYSDYIFFLFGEKFSSKAPGSFSQVEKLLV